MTLPAPDELEPLLVLCRKHGVRAFKAGDVEVAFGDERPNVPAVPLNASRAEMAEEDELQAQYERDMEEWRKSRGLQDDEAVDG